MLAQRSCIVDAGTAKGRIGLAELKPPSWPLRQGEAKTKGGSDFPPPRTPYRESRARTGGGVGEKYAVGFRCPLMRSIALFSIAARSKENLPPCRS